MSLVEVGLTNAALALVPALAAVVARRLSARPALVHCLWLLVLVKLITPPLVRLPVLAALPEEMGEADAVPTAEPDPVDPPESLEVVTAVLDPSGLARAQPGEKFTRLEKLVPDRSGKLPFPMPPEMRGRPPAVEPASPPPRAAPPPRPPAPPTHHPALDERAQGEVLGGEEPPSDPGRAVAGGLGGVLRPRAAERPALS